MNGQQDASRGGEQLWHNLFFYFSAFMAALALVDLSSGRLAHAMGDAGVACLLVSLMNQYRVVRAVIAQSREPQPERGELLREAERLRAEHPWIERASGAGWMLLLGSLALRLAGVQ
jgi:hypothetical protein